MKWFVEVAAITGGERVVKSVLERVGYELHVPTGGKSTKTLLSHEKYQRFETASQVHEDAKRIANVLSQFSKLYETQIGIQFGAVQSEQLDGTRNIHAFGELQVAVSVAMSATGTVTRDPSITETERKRLDEELVARVAEQKTNEIIRRASVALKNPKMLEIMKLMSISEPTGTELGHIVDLVQEACGGDLGKLASDRQLKRFKHSINDPSVFGLRARHFTCATNAF